MHIAPTPTKDLKTKIKEPRMKIRTLAAIVTALASTSVADKWFVNIPSSFTLSQETGFISLLVPQSVCAVDCPRLASGEYRFRILTSDPNYTALRQLLITSKTSGLLMSIRYNENGTFDNSYGYTNVIKELRIW